MSFRPDPQLIRRGTFRFTGGPMKSRKSDGLFTLEDQSKFMPDQELIVLKPETDFSTDYVWSELRNQKLACETFDPERPKSILDLVKNYHTIIGIDESQFVVGTRAINDLVFVINYLRRAGKHIEANGLTSDWRRQPFGAVPAMQAIPGADIVTLRAICDTCGGPADYTQKLIDGEPAHFDSGKQVEVDLRRGVREEGIIVPEPEVTYKSKCYPHHILPGTRKGYRY